MPGQSTEELFVAGASGGHVWMAPVGTTPPVGIAVPGTGWVDMGYLSEDGAEITPGVETEKVKVWPLPTTARVITTERTMEVKFAFAQWNADTIATYLGGGWTDDVDSRTLAADPAWNSETAILIEANDNRTIRLFIPRGAVTGYDSATWKLGEIATMGLTYEAMVDSAGKWVDFIDDKVEVGV